MQNFFLQNRARLFLSLALVLLPAACAKHSANSVAGGNAAIVNGQAVQPQEAVAHSTVALYLDMSQSQDADKIAFQNVCTGTLIAPDVVLTAAHCFVDLSHSLSRDLHRKIQPDEIAGEFRIGFGTQIVKSPNDAAVEFRSVAAYQVNPKYVFNAVKKADTVPMYDMALIKLNAPAPASATPAALIRDASVLQKGLAVDLVGFGLLNEQPVTEATQLMEVTVNVDNPNFSVTQWTYQTENGKGSCSGDSGGPAYVIQPNGSYGLIGVTSWGDNGCTQMGAYTSVPTLAPWIDSVVGGWD